MTTAYIADTGVFVRCGSPDKDKFQRLRRALQQTDVTEEDRRREIAREWEQLQRRIEVVGVCHPRVGLSTPATERDEARR
jgi:hypothetical protein